ncbi:hypothetical protein DIPPA_14802 [Diplonema papillatum]|nr:hypothetical protein DIPPA_14802 [Diplonema papillatum]
MGNCCEHSAFGPQTLADKEKELYLGANAIKSLYRVFVQYSLATDTMGIPGTIDDKDLPQERHAHDPRVWRGSHDGGTMLLRQQQFLCMPWFRKNPFAPRVFECFKDAGEYMTFEAFVTLDTSANSLVAGRRVHNERRVFCEILSSRNSDASSPTPLKPTVWFVRAGGKFACCPVSEPDRSANLPKHAASVLFRAYN